MGRNYTEDVVMRFVIEIDQDNAAFEDSAASETARILRSVARRYEGGDLEGDIRDENGNTIGQYYTEF